MMGTRLGDLREMRDALLDKMAAPDVNGQTYVAMAKTLIEIDEQLAAVDAAFAAVPAPPREETPLNDFSDELAARRASRSVPPAAGSAVAGGVRH